MKGKKPDILKEKRKEKKIKACSKKIQTVFIFE